MVTRADLDAQTAVQARLVDAARADLAGLWPALPIDDPDMIRDALMEVVPQLADTYGAASEAAALDWYSVLRGREDGLPRYVPPSVAPPPAEDVQGAVRRVAGHLWTPAPELTLTALEGVLQRAIRAHGRGALAAAVDGDPSTPMWARVPRGPKTCAFCAMLASRGWAYTSEKKAGADQPYHNDCDCEIVPSWKRKSRAPHIRGYDPDKWRSVYQDARNAVGRAGGNVSDPKELAAVMRRQNPGLFKDGVGEGGRTHGPIA